MPRWTPSLRPSLLSLLAVLAGGCGGSSKESSRPSEPVPEPGLDDTSIGEEPECVAEGPARSPLRRLTPAELDRTLTDLVGTEPGLALATLPPEQVGGFSNNVDVRPVGADTVDAYSRLATAAAAIATAEPATLLPCPDLFGDVELTVEAETGLTDTGVPQTDDMGLYSAGYVEVGFEVEQAGDYRVGALLRGSECEGVLADWALEVDGTALADGLSTEEWTWEEAEVALEAGAHTARITFAEDCYLPELREDRNLFVDQFRVQAEGLPVGEPEDFSVCVSGWLADFTALAWRRPLEDPSELPRLVDFYDAMAAEWGPTEALRLVVEVVLQSPRFLYRIEDTALEAAPGEVVPLDGYELASRLSYFLWGTMPDAELLAAAAAGELDTVEGLEARAVQMLEDPRAEELLELFFAEWMALDHIDEVEKDAAVYPAWTEERPESFREETLRFVRAVWHEEGARFDTLLTASWTIADAELAAFYGYDSDGSGDDWERVERDPAAHAGLLTHGAFLASRARSYGSSPIHRGMFVRGSMLCHVIPAPDPSLEIEVPDPDPDATTRETLEQHREDPVCASCHDYIDPPGLAFEHFDGIGRYRTEENGLPVDASVDIVGTDFNGRVDGVAQLAQAMVHSQMVHECFSRQWFRYAHGRREAEADICEIEDSAQVFAADALDMKSLVLSTITSPAFRSAIGSP